MEELAFIRLTVLPPPLSACFVNSARVGRVASARYEKFKRIVDVELARTCRQILGTPYKAKFTCEVIAWISMQRPKGRSDIDNRCKAALDLLTRNHILKDDSQVVSLHVCWDDAQSSPLIIRIASADF